MTLEMLGFPNYPPFCSHLSPNCSAFVLDLPPRMIIVIPSRSGEGRVAIVFETRSGMRMAATMPDPGRSEDRRPENGQGQTPATRADGPSACPGDSSHERGRVGASDNPWDMQQAAKSIRVRNAGEDLLPRPGSAQRSSALGWTTARVPSRKRQAGCPYANTCGRRGRGFSPSRSARPYGRRKAFIWREWRKRQARVTTGSPRPDKEQGDDACSEQAEHASSGCLTIEERFCEHHVE